MVRRICGVVFTLAAVFSFSGAVQAQEEIFAPGFQLGPGSRSIAMGGAFTSLGGDYTASFWNPAALADIRRVEFYGSLSYLSRGNTFSLSQNLNSFSNTANRDDENFTDLNNIGIAYPIPTYRGSLVFSFGFNRIKSYDSNFEFGTFNQTENDLVNQAWREIDSGGLNAWTLASAVDISPNTSLGLALNFWTGGSEFTSTFREVDIDNLYQFQDFTRDDVLKTDISGFNVKIGALHRLGSFMRFGFTATSPVTYNVDEEWSTAELLTFDEGTSEEFFDEGVFDYKIRSPWTFTTGASLNLLDMIVVAGDLEFVDWSDIRYESEPPFAGLTESQANRIIADGYGQTTNVNLDIIDTRFTVPEPRVRLGAELTLPETAMSFRAGYFRDPSVFKDALPEEDKQFFSGGVGFLLDRQVKMDIAYVHGFWKRFNSGLPETDDVGSYVEDIKVNKVFVSLAFRF